MYSFTCLRSRLKMLFEFEALPTKAVNRLSPQLTPLVRHQPTTIGLPNCQATDVAT